MKTMTYMEPDKIRAEYESGNMDVISGILSGTITGDINKTTPTVSEETEEVDENVSVDEEQVVESDVEIKEQIKLDEARRIEELAKLREEQYKLEKDQLMREKRAKQEELEQEKRAREELEKRLQTLTELAAQRPTPSESIAASDEDDDDFIPDYAKETRQIVNEIKASLGEDNPVINNLIVKINKIEQTEQKRLSEIKQQEAEKVQQETMGKLYSEVEEFQIKNPELKTDRPVREIQKDWIQFRKDIGFLVNAKDQYDVDRAIKEYRNGEDIKSLADSRGIQPVPDLDKFEILINLVDLKNGVEYDPYTKQEKPITDNQGNRVRYRSIEEAYRVSQFHNELNKARISSYKEVQDKLNTINSGPVRLPSDAIENHSVRETASDKLTLMQLKPEQYINNPVLLEKVREAYASVGMDLPAYRQKKF